ncbi:hypothetical protein GCM10008025_07060 [Ornithinibacillus halotolerans]|uniref:Peptidase C39-like domain-containing protein n=2 Tax=Ornithinibacillus halotolerans TaxID=1274357 RepID=A0A916W4R9_9BACI|nr:hypothetical protein GCM10008025_07060 [Ornithinibacillus halotolerans]
MKLILRNSFLFFLLFISIFLITSKGDKIYAFVYDFFDNQEGVVLIQSVDKEHGFPLKGTVFEVKDTATNEVIVEIETDDDGMAKLENIPINSSFRLVQTDVAPPYQLNNTIQTITLTSKQEVITIENEVNPVIETYQRSNNSEIVVTKMNLPFETVMQVPELPNGCEVTSLTAVLNYYGYEIKKTVLSDKFLPKIPFEVKDGILYGADPNKAYAGDPRSKNQGFYSYVAPIMETANRYFASNDGPHVPVDLTGSNPEELLHYIRKGIPVIIWTTINQQEPLFNYSWNVVGTDEKIDIIRNSHTVVLTGYSEDEVFVMDPLKGNVSYPKDRFFEIYKNAGSHAMIIK